MAQTEPRSVNKANVPSRSRTDPVASEDAIGLIRGLVNRRRQKIGKVFLDPGTPGLILLTSRRRAKASLSAYRGRPITAARAVAEILSRWPQAGQALDHVRPYQFLRVKGQPNEGELRILLSWTINDARSRANLYELGPEIGAELGWYPLVKGGWRAAGINPAVQLAGLANRSPLSLDFPLGQPRVLRDLTYGRGDELGVAVELQNSEGSILFDLGVGVSNPSLRKAVRRARLIVLSHAHRDHAGGLAEAIALTSAPFLMTEATLLQVLAIHMRLNRGLIRKLLDQVLVCATESQLGFEDGASLQTWSANHGPGSIASLVTTSTGQTFLYTGDISVTNAYGDSVRKVIAGTTGRAMPRRLDLAVIDGTFLGRRLGPPSESSVFSDFILGCIHSERTALVVADAADIALLLFVELHHLVMSSDRKQRDVQAYVGPQTSALMTLIASAYIDGRLDDMGPELKSLWQKRQNVFESHQIWHVDQRVLTNVSFQVRRREHLIFVLTPAELQTPARQWRDALTFLAKSGIDTLLVGRAKERPFAKRLRETSFLEVGSTPIQLLGSVQAIGDEKWGLHSAATDLLLWMSGDLGQQLDQVRIFHNFPARVQTAVGGLARYGVLPLAEEELLMPLPPRLPRR
jgi:Cft2 family RNA processing exonuclease